MDAEMFLQRNKIGTHVLGDRIVPTKPEVA
jgi:hypothetical protein